MYQHIYSARTSIFTSSSSISRQIEKLTVNISLSKSRILRQRVLQGFDFSNSDTLTFWQMSSVTNIYRKIRTIGRNQCVNKDNQASSWIEFIIVSYRRHFYPIQYAEYRRYLENRLEERNRHVRDWARDNGGNVSFTIIGYTIILQPRSTGEFEEVLAWFNGFIDAFQ